jgi:hypothetical protein
VAIDQLQAEAPVPVDETMVRATEEQEVLKRRRATVGPVDDVMRVAPGMRSVTAREPATAVTDDHGTADSGGDDRCAPADVERLRAAFEHHAHDRRVAGDPASHLGRHGTDVVELAAKHL